MTVKQWAIACGIALLLPYLIFSGVLVISPKPEWRDYKIQDYQEQLDNASNKTEKKQELKAQQKQLQRNYQQAKKMHKRHLFYACVLLGTAALIGGAVVVTTAGIGSGLMFGGIFSIFTGYLSGWGDLSNGIRFLTLLVLFAILIGLGYQKQRQTES